MKVDEPLKDLVRGDRLTLSFPASFAPIQIESLVRFINALYSFSNRGNFAVPILKDNSIWETAECLPLPITTARFGPAD
jgi:hypothetical protein